MATLLVGEPILLRVRDLAGGEPVAERRTAEGYRVCWHPDGQILAVTGEDRKVYLYDPRGPKPLSILEHRNVGLKAEFSPRGGLLATNGWERRLRVWRPFTGEVALSFPARDALGFRRDGRQFAAATPDNAFALYDVADGREYRTLVARSGWPHASIAGLSLHPRGRLLAVEINFGLGFWDIEHDVQVASLPLAARAEFTASGDLLTTGSTGSHRWKVREDDDGGVIRVGPPSRLPLPAGEQIRQSRDGRFLGVAHWDTGTTLVDADHPDRPIRLRQHDARFLAISPDGRWAATGSHQTDDGVKVWSLPDGQLVHQVPNASDTSWALFSPDGRWLVINTSGRYRVRPTSDWTGGPERAGSGLVFTPDSRLLAVADASGSIRLVEPGADRLIATLEDPNSNRAIWAATTPDGSRLIFTSPDSLATHVWDLRAIRDQLAEMDLDWDWPRLPPADPAPAKRATPARIRARGSDRTDRSRKLGTTAAHVPRLRSRSARRSATVSKPGKSELRSSSRSQPRTFFSAEMTVEWLRPPKYRPISL